MALPWVSTLLADLRFELTAQPAIAPDREAALVDFVLTPLYAERVLSFGTLLCLDAFLQTLTIVPLRAVYQLLKWQWLRGWDGDLYRFVILAAVYRVLQSVNASRVYHGMRGQAGITMFVMYSLMDVCDKFLCSVGHDISECLVSPRTAASRRRAVLYSAAAFLYTVVHSFVLMWQLVTINLAVNSYSNALLSYMLTQQIGEIKTAVFKRADRSALFQVTCADITQRFQLGAILLVIVARNIAELAWARALTWTTFCAVCGPPSLLMAEGVLVDWLKCAYMTSFNSIKPGPLYMEFFRVLKQDYAHNFYRGAQHLLSKQAGLPVAPLAVVCVRMFAKNGVLKHWVTPVMFAVLLLAKLRLGRWLRAVSAADSLASSVSVESLSSLEAATTRSHERILSAASVSSETFYEALDLKLDLKDEQDTRRRSTTPYVAQTPPLAAH